MLKKYMLRALAMAMAAVLLLTSSAMALTLRYPQKGDDVADLQRALKQLGYYSKEVDGQFGTGTRTAVRAFQRANGLSVDGVAGQKTLDKIKQLTGIDVGGAGASGGSSSGGSAPVTPTAKGLFGGNYTTIKYGHEGERVKILQRALKALGFEVNVDGECGSGTYTAVKEFQKLHSLTVDGMAGKKTLQKLESYFDEKGNCTSGPIVTKPPVADEEDKDDFEYDVPTRTLRYGMTGEDVKYTQQRLYTLGYYTGSRDGQFGSGMLAAVKAFQKKHNLTADGVIGAGTRAVLFSSDALGKDEAPEEEARTLRYGMEGEDVARLQLRLKELGYYTGTADGRYGSSTQTAVKDFQRKNRLNVDGVCGPDTVKAVYDKNAIPAGSSEETPGPSDPVVPDEPLEWGDKGDAVTKLQSRLKELGYYTIKVDGQFGSGTYTALRAFQQRNNLTVNGKADQATLSRLYSDEAIKAEDDPADEETPPPSTIPTRTLRYGMQGEDVKLMQNRLIALGYLKGTADGSFGTSTLQALRAFQTRHGLTADGVAGAKTYAKLFSDDALEPTPTPGVGDTSIIPERTLNIGDSGDDVKSVQQRLKDLDYAIATIDGAYGEGTAAAMKAFQQMNGLTANGNGNLATYAKLYSDNAVTAKGVQLGESVPAYTNLKVGATGTAVIRLQQALRALNYDVQVSGAYDKATSQIVRSFQIINGLSADGVAGKKTQTKLYSGSAKGFTSGPENAVYGSMGYVAAPAKSQIKLLHWNDDIKNNVAYGNALLCYDPATGISWSLTIIARGRHCDVEPSTAADTAAMHKAFGGKETWTPKPVYVRLPDGAWTVATTHNVAHGINPIPDNDFEGQNCVHFLRDMSETEEHDKDYGVTNQNALRKFWKELTGEDIAYK